jgi:hypothetical protein
MFRNEVDALNNTRSLIILGTIDDSFTNQFEIYGTIVSNPLAVPKISNLSNVSFNNLGNNGADINGLTLFKVKGLEAGAQREIFLSNVSIQNAGDDGLEIFGGRHIIDTLVIDNALDDGLDLDFNATLRVTVNLSIQQIANQSGVPGVIEVLGAVTTLNRVELVDGAQLYLNGNTSDKVAPGIYTASGSFDPWSTNIPIFRVISSVAADTFLEGLNP